jgi:hypothetical protein
LKTQPNAAQIKQLKSTIRSASDDLEHVTEFLVAELHSAHVAEGIIGRAVQSAAQRHLWLAVSDHAYRDFGLDMPEYRKAGGTRARQLVDASAVRFTQRLANVA